MEGEPFDGSVVIIGAGAGGLSAGYFLQQLGIEFQILEASSQFGGRMKINSDFADFPIPLGAEWLETAPDILKEILNKPNASLNIQTVKDEPDYKFVNYSWLNFFEDFILPSIANKISYNNLVTAIDYSNDPVIISTAYSQLIADKVIVSVPLKMMQNGTINFNPALPQVKLDAIHRTEIWEGFKAFFEFSSKFYDEEYVFPINPASDGEKIYYNASFGQNTNRHILGLFAVGKPARDYTTRSGEELKTFILKELDDIYDNKATSSYKKHIAQNWNDEPYIQSGYMSDFADWRTVREIGKTVADKLYFAGAEFTDGEDWVSVHAAALAAKKAVDQLTN